MARLRYSLAEAGQAAKRLAVEYVSKQAAWTGAVFRHVAPVHSASNSPSSKHAVMWCAVFDLHWPVDVVVDGGELMFEVNIETKEVRQWSVG